MFEVEAQKAQAVATAARKAFATMMGIEHDIGMMAAVSIAVSIARQMGLTKQRLQEVVDRFWETKKSLDGIRII